MHGIHQLIPEGKIVMRRHIVDYLCTALRHKACAAVPPTGYRKQKQCFQTGAAVYKPGLLLVKHMSFNHISGIITENTDAIIKALHILL